MSETDGLAYTAALMMKVVEDDGMLSSYTFEHVVNVLVVNRFMSQKPKEGSLGSAWYEKQFRKLPQGSLSEAIKAVLEATPSPTDEDVEATADNGVSLRLKMKMEWRFNLIAAVVTRFIFCVCGMKLQGNNHYGNTRFSKEQGLELIKLAKLDEIFSLKALGGSMYYSEAALLDFMSDFYQYNERVYLADRIIDHLYLNMVGVSSDDFHLWKFSNARSQAQIQDLSDDWKKQLKLAKQGHRWFVSLPKFSSHLEGGQGGLRAPNSAGGSGGGSRKRRASSGGGKERVRGRVDSDDEERRDLFGDDEEEDENDEQHGRTPSPPQQGSACGSGGFGSGGGASGGGARSPGNGGGASGGASGGTRPPGNGGGASGGCGARPPGNGGGASGGGARPLGNGSGKGHGERRGVGDTDETSEGLVMSHRRYVEQTKHECNSTGAEPKVWVNQYMAKAAGTQAGRTVGSFLLAMQDQVPSWQGQIPKMLARMRGKYAAYQEQNPSASCPQLGVVEAAIAWVEKIAPVLARPAPPPPPAFGESDEEATRSSPAKPLPLPKPPPALEEEDDVVSAEVRCHHRSQLNAHHQSSSMLSTQREAAWAAAAPERTTGHADTAASRTAIRIGFMQMAKGAATYAAVQETAAAAEQPASLAARSNKAPMARGRILSKGHLNGGIQVVRHKLETTKYREQEDEWWERGGEGEEDGQDGEDKDDEFGVSKRRVRRGRGQLGSVKKVTVKAMREEMCRLGYRKEAKLAKRWPAVKVALEAARAAPPRQQMAAGAAAAATSSEDSDDYGDKDEDDDDEGEDNNEFEDDNEYEATILDSKISEGMETDGYRKGTKLYKIAWAGYSAESASWEPHVNVGLELIKEYENSLPD